MEEATTETCECLSPLVESEHDSDSWPSKRLVWVVGIGASLVVDFGLMAGALHLGMRLWA